jgi:8-oxo-dGTP pyrophosphatase MutT (NUDIX family)
MRRPVERSGNPRLAAVLVLLYPVQRELSLVLTRRHEYQGVHSGQISLPGGQREDGESFAQTALRETHEELGINVQGIQLVGKLTQVYIPPSDYEVHPYVGYSSQRPAWKPDPAEVAEVIEMPLAMLFENNLKRSEVATRNGVTFEMPYYAIQGHKVWGATAAMLSEFEERLRRICGD